MARNNGPLRLLTPRDCRGSVGSGGEMHAEIRSFRPNLFLAENALGSQKYDFSLIPHGSMEEFVDPRVEYLSSYLLANCEKDFRLREVASQVNLSDSYLAHLFRRETGISPQRFLKRVRLDRARQLLVTTFLSVKEVVVQTGFNDASHFVKEFEKLFGESPSNYRKHHVRLPSTTTSNKQQPLPIEEYGNRPTALRECADP